jgi:hypothetical protein
VFAPSPGTFTMHKARAHAVYCSQLLREALWMYGYVPGPYGPHPDDMNRRALELLTQRKATR